MTQFYLKKIFVSLCALFSTTIVWAQYDGTPTQPATGTGSVADPYIITNAKELYWFANKVNNDGSVSACAKLGDNIVVNPGTFSADGTYTPAGTETLQTWKVIGNNNKKYSGTFDGDGYTISGLYVNNTNQYQGFIGCASKAIVKNLTIDNSYIKGGRYTGGIVGRNGVVANTTLTISNLHNKAIVVSSANDVGGVIGYIANVQSEALVVFENCSNESEKVSGAQHVGGIVGYIDGGGTFTNCHNGGAIFSTSTSIGGLCGLSDDNNNGVTKPLRATDCYNTGNISGSQNYVGGLVGCVKNESYYTDCYNTGNVVGANQCVGGIVGNSKKLVELTNCHNEGDISSTLASGNGEVNVGGLVGKADVAMSATGCANSGVVSGNRKNVGGIVGQVSGLLTIDNSNNSGSVTAGNENTGGIVGYATGGLTIENVSNSGNVSGTRDVGGIGGLVRPPYSMSGTLENTAESIVGTLHQVGGIFGATKDGSAPTTELEIANAVNYAAVSGTHEVGGIIGYNSRVAKVTNCENNGTITGTSNNNKATGGICGKAENLSKFTFSNCHNKAAITSAGTYVGGIVGQSTVACVVTDSYNISDITANGGRVGGIVGSADNSCTVTNSHNEGKVYGSATIGGIVSYANVATITNCNNKGEIVNGTTNVGGILGYANQTATITSCNNGAEVKGTQYVGGIVGRSVDALHATSCANSGYVYGSSSNVGGVVGYNDRTEVTLKSCTNSANVKGISNISGLVGRGSAVTIEDCTNSGESVTATGIYSGGLVGQSVNACVIKDSHNEATVSSNNSTSDLRLGGLVGSANSTLNVSDSYNTASVESKKKMNRIGGVVGYVGGAVTIDKSYNEGAVTGGVACGGVVGYAKGGAISVTESHSIGNVTGTYYVGGIIGQADNGGANVTTITNCYNKGSIRSTQTTNSSGSCEASGLLAICNSVLHISYSYNIGSVTSYAYASGVVSTLNGGSTDNPNNIFHCYNTGDITTTGKGMSVGITSKISGGKTNISYCWNSGNIAATAENTDEAREVAGIVGKIESSSNVTLDSCSNSGTISAYSAVGGIIARNNGSANNGPTNIIRNCVNTGKVIARGEHAYGNGGNLGSKCGGILGCNDNAEGKSGTSMLIVNCHNSGELEGISAVGGIVGINDVGSCTLSVDNCSSSVNVSGEQKLGGIVGMNTGNVTFSNLNSSVSVTGEQNIGGILGYNKSGTTSFSTCNVSDAAITGNDNVGGILGYNDNGTTSFDTCSIQSGVSVEGTTYVGGILGRNTKSGNNGSVTFNLCSIQSGVSVEGTTYVGGILGYSNGTSNFIASNTQVGAEVVGTTNVGGFVSYAQNGQALSFTNCTNGASVRGEQYVGGFIGQFQNNQSASQLTNVCNYGEVSGSMYVGGIAGYLYMYNIKLSLSNVNNEGNITSETYAGGLFGRLYVNNANLGTLIANCYNRGNVEATTQYAGGMLGYLDTDKNLCNVSVIANVYNAANISSASYAHQFIGKAKQNVACSNCYYLGRAGEDMSGIAVSATQFANGSVAFALNKDVSDGSQAWHQTIGTDAYPYPSADGHSAVYYAGNLYCDSYLPTGTASNSTMTGSLTKIAHNYDSSTGICSQSGVWHYLENTDWSLSGTTYTITVGTIGDLFSLANLVNRNNNNTYTYNVTITNDIVVNPGTFSADGTYTAVSGEHPIEWTPIATRSVCSSNSATFKGSVEGGGHTISGLYINDGESINQGLIGYVGSATTSISNLGILNSYIEGGSNTGAFIGNADNIVNLTKCWNEATIAGRSTADWYGGLVGRVQNGNSVFKYCYNRGTVKGGLHAGGISGSQNNNTKHLQCYNTGTIDCTTEAAGIAVGANAIGCYYLEGASAESTKGESKSETQFNSGEVCYLLNQSAGAHIYRQVVSTLNGKDVERYPILYFSDDESLDVYKLTFDENGTNVEGEMNPIYYNSPNLGSLPTNTYTRADYIYKYWNTDATDQTESSRYNDEATITDAPADDFTLYAIWLVDNVRWTGATDTDWFNTSNWSSNTIPNETNKVFIPFDKIDNFPVLTGDLGEAKSIDISDGATLTIESGVLKTDSIVANGDGHVVIHHRHDGMSQLFAEVYDEDEGLASNTSVYRTINGRQWYYVIRGVQEDVAVGSLDDSYLYLENYDYTTETYAKTQDIRKFNTDYTGATVAFAPTGEHTFTEQGTILSLNTPYTYTLGLPSGQRLAWHLIGNPYQIALPLPTTEASDVSGETITNGVFTFGKNVSPGIFFRNYNTSERKYYTSSYNLVAGLGVGSQAVHSIAEEDAYIAPMKSFFVRDLADGQTFSIDPSSVTPDGYETVTLKANRIRTNVLRLTVSSDNALTDETALVFCNIGSLSSTNFDTYKRAESAKCNQIYALKGSTRLAIPLMPTTEQIVADAEELPIGLTMSSGSTAGIITCTNISDFDPSIDVFLTDYQTGEMVNLREQNTYQFAVDNATINTRFAIVLSNKTEQLSTAVRSNTKGKVLISGAKSEAIVKLSGNIDAASCKVRITDLAGREVKNGMLSGNETHIALQAQGLYIVEVTDADSVTTRKILVR